MPEWLNSLAFYFPLCRKTIYVSVCESVQDIRFIAVVSTTSPRSVFQRGACTASKNNLEWVKTWEMLGDQVCGQKLFFEGSQTVRQISTCAVLKLSPADVYRRGSLLTADRYSFYEDAVLPSDGLKQFCGRCFFSVPVFTLLKTYLHFSFYFFAAHMAPFFPLWDFF